METRALEARGPALLFSGGIKKTLVTIGKSTKRVHK